MKIFTIILTFSFFVLLIPPTLHAQIAGESVIQHGNKEEKVTYELYLPQKITKKKIPVLVCVGGLPTDGDKYLRSSTRDCIDDTWKKFADENQIAILGLGFLLIYDDWKIRQSYQFPRAWSGRALLEILEKLSYNAPIDRKQLFMFGISAGAQFGARFALLHPDIVRGATLHAGGGYDAPQSYVATHFLLTVGKKDQDGTVDRVEWAEYFHDVLREKGIDARLKIISDLTHHQTEEQNQMSRDFIKRYLK